MKVRHSKSEIRRVLVVTGDPGGARVLIPAVTFLRKKHPRWKFDVLAGRNSFALWKDAGFRPKRWPSKVMERFAADKTLFSKSPDVLVTGTSFENPTESRFRRAAHEMNVPSFSALDHWCNYRHRYELTGKLILPDLIGVMDDFAVTRMVESGIPRKHLTVVGHPVLEPFLKKKKRATSDGSTSLTTGRRQILYLSEPISWDGNLNPRVIRYPRHNELTVLTNLLAVFARHPEILGYDLRIRPHPLEPLSRIKAVLRNHAPSGLRVTIDRSHSLEEEFDASRVVLGITSIALLQALLMRMPVLSLQPDHARGWIPDDISCFLPRVASSGCFIEAVSNFVRTRRVTGRGLLMGRKLRLPNDSRRRIASEIEKLAEAGE